MTNETISEKCKTFYNKLNSFVTSVITRDVTPKISNLNTEVWGSNAQTGDSRIDTLEFDVDSLNNSITNITGFSLVYDGYDHRIRVYSNGILAYFLMQGAFFVNSGGTSSNGSIPSQYAPTVQTTIKTHPAGTDGIMLGSDGSITYYATKGTDTSRIVRIAYCYPLKASFP